MSTDLQYETSPCEGEIKFITTMHNDRKFNKQYIFLKGIWRYHGLQTLINQDVMQTWYFDNGVQINGPDGFWNQVTYVDGRIGYTRIVVGRDADGHAIITDDSDGKTYIFLPSTLGEGRLAN